MKNYSLKKNALIMPKSKKQCQEIRDTMRATILQKSLLYFARNGFSGTKISIRFWVYNGRRFKPFSIDLGWICEMKNIAIITGATGELGNVYFVPPVISYGKWRKLRVERGIIYYGKIWKYRDI